MNKPVAWMFRMKNSGNKWELIFNKPMSDEFFETIPLYTHPVKKLTDEEIKQAKLESWQQCKDTTEIIDFELSYQDELFAKAILRKAQEK